MSDFYWLTKHRHLTLLPKDSCNEIRILRPALSYYSLWIHTAMRINISISHHLVWQDNMTWKTRLYFKPRTKSYEPSSTLINGITSSMWFHYISVESRYLITGLIDQYTLTTISTRYFISWKYYVLITLSHHSISHVTHQYTIQSHHIF